MLKPTPEIIAQAKSLTYYVEHLIDPLDPECNGIFYDWCEITEKYDFYDQIFEENGHVGLKDVEGHVRVPALYHDFDETFDIFSCRDLPVSAINDEGKVALVTSDGTGTPLCDFIYDHILLSQGSPYYITMQNKKCGIMTSRGEALTPCIYDHIEDYNNGIFITQKDGKYGFFCEEGRGFTVPNLYDEIDEDNRYLYARLGNQWGYFDHQGHFLPKSQTPDPQQADALSIYPYLL